VADPRPKNRCRPAHWIFRELEDARSLLLVAVLVAGRLAWGQSFGALEAEIQGKQADDVREVIIRRLGPPDGTFGSGLRIETWNIEGGVLTFNPVSGPFFEKGGKRVWLMHTANPAGLCLYGHYEMRAKPEASYGMKYYLGDLYLARDSSYLFAFDPARTEDKKSQAGSFFVLYPRGSVEVKYASGVSAETRMEDLPDGSLVATLTFVARPSQRMKLYRVIADHTGRVLRFESGAMPFEMDKGWVNYWR